MELSEARPRAAPAGVIVNLLRKVLSIQEVGVLIPLVIFIVIFSAINPVMLSRVSLLVILRTISYAGVIAVGMSFLIIAGEIDLSVGSVAGLGAIVAGWMMKNAGWPVPAGVLAGLLTGALCGLINGLMTVKVGLPAFVATLAMLWVAKGINYVITGAYPIYPLPPFVAEFGMARPLGVSWPFVVFIVLVIVADFILRQTVFGSMVTATGGNKHAARISGINTDRVKIACFVLTGMLAALAGMLVMARIKTAEPQIGIGWELEVIASVVMGGVSFLGGVGTILGTFLGIILIQVVRSGLVVVGVSAHWQNVAIGMLLVAAAAVDLLRRQARRY